ncbi:MAG: T9SS type A sorting domain-containing protein [Saprospiraceae bacterium]|nr:T9SS type A sorting domain-containing protein [Saprospiraceae bacterium]
MNYYLSKNSLKMNSSFLLKSKSICIFFAMVFSFTQSAIYSMESTAESRFRAYSDLPQMCEVNLFAQPLGFLVEECTCEFSVSSVDYQGGIYSICVIPCEDMTTGHIWNLFQGANLVSSSAGYTPCFSINGGPNGFTVEHVYDGDTCSVGPFSVIPDTYCPGDIFTNLYYDTCQYAIDGDLIWGLIGSGTEVFIDWGDGSYEVFDYNASIYHAFPIDGTYEVCVTYNSGGEGLITCCYTIEIPEIDCCLTADFTFYRKETSESCINPEYYISATCQKQGTNHHTWIFENGDTLVNSGILTFDDFIFTDWVNTDNQVCVTHIVICCGDTLSVTKCLSHPNGAFLGLPGEDRRLTDDIHSPWGPRVVNFIKNYSQNLLVPLLIDGRLILDLDEVFIDGWWNMGNDSKILNEGHLFGLWGTTLQSAGRLEFNCCRWWGVESEGYTRTTWKEATISDAVFALHYPSLTSSTLPRLSMQSNSLLINVFGIKSVGQPVWITRFHDNEIVGADHNIQLCDCAVINAIDFRNISSAYTTTFPVSGSVNTIRDYEQAFHFDNANLNAQNFDVYDLVQLPSYDPSLDNAADSDAGIGIDFHMGEGSSVGQLGLDKMTFEDISSSQNASGIAVRAFIESGHLALSASAGILGDILVDNVQIGYRIDLENGATMNGGIINNELNTLESSIITRVLGSSNNYLNIRYNDIVNNGGGTLNAHAIGLTSFPPSQQDFYVRDNNIVAQNAPGGAAVHLFQIEGAEVTNNVIDNGASTVHGIHVRKGGHNYVKCNEVISYKYGLFGEGSAGNTYGDNLLQYNRHSLLFAGDNFQGFLTNTEWNTFQAANLQDVFFSTNDCITGAQDHTRYNSWLGQSGTEIKHVDLGNAPFCRFYYPTTAAVGSIHRPYADPSSLLQATNDTEEDLPGTYCSNPTGPGEWEYDASAESLYLSLLSDTSLVSNYSTAQISDLERTIYRLLQDNPSWSSTDTTYANFLSDQTGTFVEVLEALNTGLLLHRDTLDLQAASMASNRYLLDSLQVLIAQLYGQANATSDSTTAAGYLAQADTFVIQADIIADSLAVQVASYSSANAVRLSVLSTQCSSISASETHETWMVTLQAILIDLLKGEALDSTQVSNLRSIAEACTEDGGEAVIIARGVCLEWLDEVYSDSTCIPAFQGGNTPNNSSREVAWISPNPASNDVIVTWTPGNTNKTIKLEVIDLTGRVLWHRADIQEQVGSTTVPLNGIPSGIVFIRILDNDYPRILPLLIQR